MISDIITPTLQPEQDSTERVNAFIGKVVEEGNKAKEAEAKIIAQQPKYTVSQKLDAAMTDNVYGYTTLKEFVTKPYEGIADYYSRPETELTPITDKERSDILKGAMVAPEDAVDFVHITDMETLSKDLGRYANKKEAEQLLNSLPLSENLGYTMAASLVDPASWAIGAGIGKVFKGAEMTAKFTGASALAFKGFENAVTIGGAVGISEALLQQENRVVEPERLKDTIMYSSMLGAGVSLLPSAIVGSGSLASQAMQSHGVQMALDPVRNFARTHMVFNPIDQILGSKTAPQFMKDLSDKAGLSVFAKKDINGNFITSNADHAIGYKTDLEKHTLDAIKEVYAYGRANNMTTQEASRALTKDYRSFEAAVQAEADRMYMTKSKQELHTIFEAETGTLLPTKRGRVVEPEDFYNVVTNSFKREFELKPPAGLEIPKHLEFIHNFFKAYGDEASILGVKGVAGKSSYGYAPRSYDIDYINSVPRETAVQHFTEMLTANKLTQSQLLTAKPVARAALEADIKATAEELVQKALDNDLRARYLDTRVKGGSRVKATFLRSYKLDTSLYPEYFSKDIIEDMVSYHDSMGGRFAAKKYFGLETDSVSSIGEKLENLKLEATKQGATKKDVDNFGAIIESVLGTRKMQSDPNKLDNFVGRIGKKVASAMYSAGFSAYSLAEVGSVIAKHGLYNTITEFIPAHKHMLNLIKGLDKKDPLIGYFNDVGLAGMWLRDMKSMRFETESLTPYRSKGEQYLDNVNILGRKVSFFNHIQDTLDFMAGGAYLNDLNSISKRLNGGGKLTTAELSKFSRYGLSEQDIRNFAIQDIKLHSDGKLVSDYNFYGWKDQDLSKRVLQSLRNAVSDTIVRTDGTKIHRWQSEVDGIVKPLLLQYTQFPVAAYERLMLNMEEQTARTVTGAIAAMTISYTMLDLQDAALVQAGVKDVRTEPSDMAVKAFMKTQFATVLPSIWDMIASVGGMKTTSGYDPAKGALPSAAAISTANKLIGNFSSVPAAVADGDWDKVLSLTGANVPMLNALPFIKAGFKSLTKQTETERGEARMAGIPAGGDLMGRIEDTTPHKLFNIGN